MPETLDELLALLQGAPSDETALSDYCTEHGLPTHHGQLATDDLPTFGGENPDAGNQRILSWDADRVLVWGAYVPPNVTPVQALRFEGYRIVAR